MAEKKPWEEYDSGKPKPKKFVPGNMSNLISKGKAKIASPLSAAEDVISKVKKRNKELVKKYGEVESSRNAQEK